MEKVTTRELKVLAGTPDYPKVAGGRKQGEFFQSRSVPRHVPATVKNSRSLHSD
jgi:hypothetical protein